MELAAEGAVAEAEQATTMPGGGGGGANKWGTYSWDFQNSTSLCAHVYPSWDEAEEVGTGHVHEHQKCLHGSIDFVLLFCFFDGCFSSSGSFQQVKTGRQS